MITLGAREHHRFEAAGKPFVYLVPSAAIFALDDAADAILRTLSERPRTREELVAELAERHDHAELDDTISELARVRAIGEFVAPERDSAPPPKIFPLAPIESIPPFPLTTMVLNVTNQCNLSCTYC